MAVEIELFGNISPGKPRKQSLELERSMTVRDVIDMLGIESEQVGLIVVNAVQSELDDLVPQDCRLCFLPYLSGG